MIMVMGYERVNCGWLGWLCPLVSILLGAKMRIDRIDRHDCSFYMNEWTAILDLGSWKVGKLERNVSLAEVCRGGAPGWDILWGPVFYGNSREAIRVGGLCSSPPSFYMPCVGGKRLLWVAKVTIRKEGKIRSTCIDLGPRQ